MAMEQNRLFDYHGYEKDPLFVSQNIKFIYKNTLLRPKTVINNN